MGDQRDEDVARNAPTDRGADDSDVRTPFTTGDNLLRAVLAASEPALEPSQALLAAGAVIADNYEIIERLGAGGMGIVYLARDRRLGRKVALKLIRTGPSLASVTRLEREAQAIAKLSHPNVVTVYQIGTHDEQPFVAMEYVDAGTARTWLEAKPRTWREIVALYLAAGRGLEAAHRAHLVHRDFKPDNVLVGDDGRVRVADFGLVASVSDAAADAEAPAPASSTATVTGTIMGTPAYMAPEQRRGGIVDAAADQYAFAVSLWEALTGARPSTGSRDAPTAKDSEPASTVGPPKQPIPRHLEAALRRALSVDPAARWPSMGPLLAVLARDPSARRRRLLLAAGGMAAATAIVVPLAMRGGSAPAPCTDSQALIAPSWDTEKRTAVVATLGPQVGAFVSTRLDEYAAAWAVAHKQACVDTRVTGSQSEDMLDRRMQCLFDARRAFDAGIAALRDPASRTAPNAANAAGWLPDVSRCADVRALAKDEALPTDPVARRNLEDATAQLFNVQLASLNPKRIDRLELGALALARARELNWRPLLARALLVYAQQLQLASRVDDALEANREALQISVAAGLATESAKGFSNLAALLAERDDIDAAQVALLSARAYDDAEGPEPMPVVLRAGSTVASRAQKHDEAIALAKEFVARIDKLPTRTINPMVARHQLASVLRAAGRAEDAIPVMAEAVAWGVANYGADHAEVGSYRAELADLYMRVGELDRATSEGTAALAIQAKWHGPTSVFLTDTLLTLADLHMRKGDLPPVRSYLERALACAKQGQDQELIAAIDTQRVIYLTITGALEEAEQVADHLIAFVVETGNTKGLLSALLVRGNLLKGQERFAEAERDFLRALEAGKPYGPDDADIQNLRVELGRAWIALGRAAETRDMLEPQAKVVAKTQVDPILLVETHTVLAAALRELGNTARAKEVVAVADQAISALPDRLDIKAIVDEWHAKYK